MSTAPRPSEVSGRFGSIISLPLMTEPNSVILTKNMATRERGRAALRDRRWSEAYAQLSTADRERPLEVDDLERLALAAHVTGNYEAKADAFARAYNECLRSGDPARAAGFAFWSAFGFVENGERARAEGWLMRAIHLVEEPKLDCPQRGYLQLAFGFRTREGGDVQAASALFEEAERIGERFHDTSLITMARQALGRTLIHLGRTAEGVALLDEAMVALTAGEVTPLLVGSVYCGVIEACQEMYDLRRAQEWTAALGRWCESQPDLVPYRGNCLVFRAELMRLHGAWPDAMEEAERAREVLRDEPAAGAALYQQGELHRLRGDLAEADDAFRAASASGHVPQPGLALLRLAQGNSDAAHASISRAVDEVRDPLFRSRLLPAYVEIMLASNDAGAARIAADELTELASRTQADYLSAIAAHARASVLLAAGDAKGAVPLLRGAWTVYRDLEAPYEAARVRELLGLACRALGDEDAAEMELDAARSVFEQLHAARDADRLRALSRARPAGPDGLTPRELEILALVATGKTNRAIATELVISEKTVARHVSNIFSKLGLSSRAALTAYAYEHRLLSART